MPRRRFSAVSISRWKANSSVCSAAERRRSRNNSRTRETAARRLVSIGSALRSEDEADRGDETVPGRELLTQRTSSGRGEPVILCPPAILGRAPFRIDPAALFQPDECRVYGALADLQRVLRELLDTMGESPTVHRRERERLE